LGAILALIARLALPTTILLVSITSLVAGVSRAAQPPLPPLLYANNARLHLFETNCPGWLALCMGRDRDLRVNLYQGFPVAQWSPDGAFIAVYTSAGWMMYRADCLLDGGDCQATVFDSDATDIRLAWGPDGSALAYMADPHGQMIRIFTRGCWDGSPPEACIQRDVPFSHEIRLPDWSKDGSQLVFISLDRDMYRLDLKCLDLPPGCLDTSQPLGVTAEGEDWPSVSSDGTAVVYSAVTINSRRVEQVFVQDSASGQRQQLTFHDAASTQPDWSADDRYIAYGGLPRRGDGNMDIYVLDLPRGIHIKLVRNPDRDMFPNWGPLPQ
jgi:Tol biopolymer transport system component